MKSARLKGYVGIALVCLFYWIIDSVWAYLSFEYNLKNLIFSEPGSWFDTFMLKVPPYQVVARLMVVFLFAVAGSLVVEFFIKRQKAERQRREAHDTLLTVLNSIDATIYVSDMQTHEILFMNQSMIDSFGGDYTGRVCHEVFRDSPEVCSSCPKESLLDESGAPAGLVVREERNPVTGTWCVDCDQAIRWLDGRTVHLQIATDITQLKELRERQQEAEKRLRQAEKMESLGTLAGGIAHDFNNVLSSIIGYTELSMEDVEKGSLLEENLREVLTAGNRAKELVRQILAFARKSGDERKPVRVDAVVKEVLQFVRPSIPSTIRIEQSIESRSLIMGTPSQIHRIMMNLCTNAAQAMEKDGGLLRVVLKDVAVDHCETWKQEDLKPGRYIELRVADTGPGMSADILESIFEPYFTTKGPGEGTGMGLAVVHGTVESCGGKIDVESEPDKGTEFAVYLPTIQESRAEEMLQPEESPGGAERILLIDDEASLANMGKQILQRLGYRVTIRTGALEALELFRAKSHAFDLIVTDMTMPYMTGDALAAEAISIRPDIPVILCSGYNKKISEKSAEKVGVKALVRKPFVKAEMARAVRKALDENRGNPIVSVDGNPSEPWM